VSDDLFGEHQGLESVRMPDAEIYFLPRIALGSLPGNVMTDLIRDTPWRQEKISIWGKSHYQPRLIAWYGDVDHRYTYSGIKLEPLPWTQMLIDLRERVEGFAEARFNSVLLNYYRNERDSMGLHSDDEPELGKHPIIASLSLGEERVFIMKHKVRKELKPVRIKLPSGSLLVMKGTTQQFWKHGIDKESRRLGARVNLTFRRIFPRESIR
jgi:alkylated DNA repair dioxygenase AlkB